MVEAMQESVKQDIIDVLLHVKDALERLDSQDLSDWSNRIIHSAAIYRDKRAIFVGIIAYSLSKSIAKKESAKDEWNNFLTNMLRELTLASEAIEKDSFTKFDSLVSSMLKQIADFDRSFSNYVEYVLEFSKLQKGARIYEHGLSLSSVAEMMGVSKWDLMRKVGETKAQEYKYLITKSSKERLEELKKLASKKG
jgi:hypothetical protein